MPVIQHIHLKQQIRVIAILMCGIFFWVNNVFSQPSVGFERTLNRFLDGYRAQKVFLHLDKDYYLAGERIWFKSYLFDGYTHKLAQGKTNVYVELVNFTGDLVMKSVFESIDGLVWGGFSTSDSLPDGNYLIRGYTNWMRNMGEDYFFQQQLYISNPEHKHYIRRWDVLVNRRFNRMLERRESRNTMAFYPEGGVLLPGAPTRLAWVASNDLGKPVRVAGDIVDGSGTVVATVHDDGSGMGYVLFTPDAGSTYEARVRFNDARRTSIIPLPEVEPSEAGIQADVSADSIHIHIHIAGRVPGIMNDSIIFLGHSRGRLIIQEMVANTEGLVRLSWPKTLFPAGVAEMILLDQGLNILSRRLVFIDDAFDLGMEVVQVSQTDDEIGLEIHFPGQKELLSGSQFSVSVTACNSSDRQPQRLFDYVMLSSDMSASMERPLDYTFNQDDVDALAADLLMMTNSWDRFDVGEVLSGQKPAFHYECKHGLFLSGEVINPANDNPVEGHKITLLIKDGVDQQHQTETDRFGVFEFAGLQFYDLRQVELVVDRMRGGYFPRIRFFGGEDRSISFPVNMLTRQQRVIQRGKPWESAGKMTSSPYQMPRFFDASPATSLYGRPSQSMYVTEGDRDNRTLLDFIVQKGAGITVQGGQILIRGAGSVFLNNEPLFMVDGTRTTRAGFLTLSLRDVHRVDVYKGPDASIFGIHGANGVLNVITRQGGMYGASGYEFMMAGFVSPGAFSPDEHILLSASDQNHRPTLYWNPNVKPDDTGRVFFKVPGINSFDCYKVVVEGVDRYGRPVSLQGVLLPE